MPPRCPMTCRVEIGVSFWGKAGQYFCTGASRSSFPLSYNCIAATAVSGFEIEASLYSVLDVAGTKFSRSAMPKPEDQTNCPFSTTATETPGMCFAAMNFETAASIWARFSGENFASSATASHATNTMRIPTSQVTNKPRVALNQIFITPSRGSKSLLPLNLQESQRKVPKNIRDRKGHLLLRDQKKVSGLDKIVAFTW